MFNVYLLFCRVKPFGKAVSLPLHKAFLVGCYLRETGSAAKPRIKCALGWPHSMLGEV